MPNQHRISQQMQYVTLWAQQSQLFWSRQQTLSLIHTGLIGAWYLARDEWYHVFAPVFGVILSIPLAVIMYRDTQYMSALEVKAGCCFPNVGKPNYSARSAAMCILGVLVFSQILLFSISICSMHKARFCDNKDCNPACMAE